MRIVKLFNTGPKTGPKFFHLTHQMPRHIQLVRTVKKLNKKPKESKSDCNVQMTDDSNKHHEYTKKNDEIMLEQSKHNYLSTILKTIFPECSLKMQTFLMNQKMALERNPNGRRWS